MDFKGAHGSSRISADLSTDIQEFCDNRGKIDAFGLHNMSVDVMEFSSFANTTGVPQLGECFNELKNLVDIMIDKNLPTLLLPENESIRRRKYPFASLDKILSILEKYSWVGLSDKLMGSSGKSSSILMLEKKDVTHLIRLLRGHVR